MDDKLDIPIVGDELVDGLERGEEAGMVVFNEGMARLPSES